MRTFVTGGTGFLGSHIVDASVARGHETVALARSTSNRDYLDTTQARQVQGDLSDVDALTAALEGVDVVFHAAARVLDYGTRQQFLAANVVGTDNLMEASRAAGVPRFVFVSSPSVVMGGADQLEVDESAPYPRRFLNLYSETKAMAEQHVLAANQPGFTTCSLRPRAIWGPRDLQGALPKMVKRMRDGRLPNVSGGSPTLASICYCENAAHACMLAAESDRVGGKCYFITDGEPVEVWSFCDELGDRFGVPRVQRHLSPRVLWAIATLVDAVWMLPWLGHNRSPPMSRYMASLLIHSATYDISSAERDLGYRPIVDRQTGFERIEAWLGDGGTDALLAHV